MRNDTTKILVVDDRPENIKAMRVLLEQLGLDLEVFSTSIGSEALGFVFEHEFALLLLDVQMPGMDGFELAELVRGRQESRHVPIIFVTASVHDQAQIFKGYESGAVDLLSKPIDPRILASKVKVFVDLDRKERLLRKQLASVKAAEERFRLLMENVKDHAIFLIDPDGLFVDWNLGAERVTGYSSKEMLGHPFELLFTQEDRDAGVPGQELGRAKSDGHASDFRWHERRGGDRFWAEGFTTALRTDAGELRGYAKVARDATNEKLAADRLQETILKLEAADRRKDEFLAVLSHELRSPLNVIAGNVELLRVEEPGTADFEESLSAIERSTKMQAQLIEDLLDVSRIITGKMLLQVRSVEVEALVKTAIESVRFAADAKGVRLLSRVEVDLGSLIGDATRLQQVFWNLLSNAVKFTHKGGNVTLSARKIDSKVEFKVEDTGLGINAQSLPHVFDRFHQEDSSKTRNYGGLGLGLAIVRHVTELHGGTVSVESDGKGLGSCFRVWIPVLSLRDFDDDTDVRDESDPRMAAERIEIRAEIEKRPLRDTSILVVDDQEEARNLVAKALTRFGAIVTKAATAREGLELQGSKDFEVIVCDIGMPEVNGFDFIRSWREVEKSSAQRFTPAIALTAYASDQDRLAALEAGFQVHHAKPVKISELVKSIGVFLGRGDR